MSVFAERLISRLQPWMTSDLEAYCRSLAAMFDPILALSEETGQDGVSSPPYIPAWGKLLDVSEAPTKALPWLGQFVGVEVPTGASDGEARALIRAESGLERGTLQAVEAAIRRNLVEGAVFQVIERKNLADETAPYHFVIVVSGKNLIKTWFKTPGSWESQTGSWGNASSNEQALREAIEAVKPGGVRFDTIITEDHPWLAVSGSWESQTTLWELT